MSSRSAELTRRAAVGVFAAAAAGFAAFGPRPRRDPLASGRTVLDYWEKWTGAEGAAMRKVVDAFNASQKRLFVRYITVSTIHQKAMIAIAGGAPPDVVGLNAYNVPAYAEAGAVLPLDALAPAQGLTLEAYAQGMRRVMTFGGRWWGCTNTGGTLALYYNRRAFREAGLDPDRPPRTIAELDEAAQRLTVKTAAGAIERAGFLHTEPGWWSWIWGYHFGDAIYDPAADAATPAGAGNVAAYRWLQSYPRSLGAGPVDAFQRSLGKYGQANGSFLTGEVAMHVQGPWMANTIRDFKPDLDYGVCPIPVAEEVHDAAAPIALIDTDMLMIPAGVRDPEASMEFVAFTQRREQVEFLATAHGKGSPMADVSEAFLAGHVNRGVRLHTALAGSARAFTSPQTKVWPEYKDAFDSMVFRLWSLQGEAEPELRRTEARAQALLDDARRLRELRGEPNPAAPAAPAAPARGGAA